MRNARPFVFFLLLALLYLSAQAHAAPATKAGKDGGTGNGTSTLLCPYVFPLQSRVWTNHQSERIVTADAS